MRNESHDMIRRFVFLMSVIALFLSVGIWLRSYWVMDSVIIPLTRDRFFSLESAIGVVSIVRGIDSDLHDMDGTEIHCRDAIKFRQRMHSMDQFFEGVAQKHGRKKVNWAEPKPSFRWRNSTTVIQGRTIGGTGVSFPHWLLAVVLSIPAWRPLWIATRKKKRRRRGLCLECGYALRGLRDPRCPECGHQNPRQTVLLTRRAKTTKQCVVLIVAWHFIMLLGTLIVVDWLLGFGASSNGVAALPQWPLRINRSEEWFLYFVGAAGMLMIGSLLSWLVLYIASRRQARWPQYWQYLWRTCAVNTVYFPLACIVFALWSRNYDASMNLPLLWVPIAAVMPTVLYRRAHRCSVGHCQGCRHDLQGSDVRCPECGTEFTT
jgi:hypothetical protein